VEDEAAGAGAELEAEADGVAADEEAAGEFEAALGLDEELEQPARARVAATTAITAVAPVLALGREGRFLTMTPSVSGYGKDLKARIRMLIGVLFRRRPAVTRR